MNKKIIISVLGFIIMFFYLSILIYSVSLFWIGFHNTDQGYNMRYLDMLDGDPDQDFRDLTNQNTYMSGQELYQLGTNQMFKAFFMSMISVAGFMICINIVVEK